MESKRDYTQQNIALQRDLLIEPVWNRNKSNQLCQGEPCQTFNRTSMESKPTQVFHVRPPCVAF